MSANSVVLSLTLENCIKITKWKVKEGTLVSVGRIILLYDPSPGYGKPQVQKLKATAVGTVRKLLVKEGDVIQPGDPLLELEKCTHPTVMKDMCAECGADLRNEDATSENSASIPMVHSIPELKVNAEQAQILGKADEERLLVHKKLVLLVDLDQTLIHTTNDNIPPNLKDVYHFRLHGSMSLWHHTRLRPGTEDFLKEMSKYYELHICTFGSRMYAHTIADFLDPDKQYFSHRILSRDECFSANSKTANLKALFPCGDNMVCIIDDREDVWNYAPNLIHVKPYHFFQHTGDINAPPGLAKRENDDKADYDFSCLGDGKKGKDNSLQKTVNEAEKDPQSDAVNLIKRKGNEPQIDNAAQDKSKTVIENLSGDIEPAVEDMASKAIEINSLNNETPGHSETEIKQDYSVLEEKNGLDNKGDMLKNISDSTDNELKRVCSVVDVPNTVDNNDTVKKEDDEDEVTSTQNPEMDKPLTLVEVKDKSETLVPVRTEATHKIENEVVVSENEASTTQERKLHEPHITVEEKTEIEKVNPDSSSSASTNEDVKSTKPSGGKETTKSKDDIEVEDTDDYLLYLEEILKRIHKEFYERLTEEVKPDMKEVVPAVRKKVLEGTNLVFSGLVPNNISLEKSRAYQVAVSLGANVTQDLQKNTTHLVAVRPGTAKVNSARRMKNVILVTADWLWVSAERWERVDEKVFPLGRNRAGTRHPPAHCGSPEHSSGSRENTSEPTTSSGRNRTASGRFMDTINPLLSFSSADIADMDQEVNDIFDESGSEEDSQLINLPPPKPKQEEDSESSSSSADSLSGEHPHGWEKHNLKRKRPDFATGAGTATESDGDEETDDMPSTKFRRGEALPSDLDLGENESESQGSEEPPDETDDGDWNMMGAALEREFLS